MKKLLTIFVFTLVTLSLVGSVALANYGSDNSLYGQVRKNKTIKGIARANVSLYNTAGTKVRSTTASKKGNYTLSDLTEGSYVVKARAQKYHSPSSKKTKTSSYNVSVDGSTKQNLYLKR